MCIIRLAMTSDTTAEQNGMEDPVQQGQDPVFYVNSCDLFLTKKIFTIMGIKNTFFLALKKPEKYWQIMSK